MAQMLAKPVKIEDPDEPFLRQAGEIAFEFISLRTSSTTPLSSVKKAPHYPKKPAGEGQQPRQTQAQGGLLPTAAAGQQVPTSRVIAERLRAIGDEIDKDITDEMLTKLFNRSRSAFTMSRGDFTSTCAGILSRFQQSFPSGWYQISFVYHAMFQTVLSLREEAEDISTVTREQQVANFVGPTLIDLGLTEWMSNHGGMENFGSPVEGEGAKAVINDSSVDPES